MATRKQPTRKAPRRKAVEPEEVERDLTNEGNPQELKDEEPVEEAKDEAPFEPKSSMTEAAKAYANLKAIQDYYADGGEGDLRKMDHPGMREGLKEMCKEGGPVDSMMQSLKDLVHEHHGADYGMEPDELMQKSVEHLDGGGPAPYDKSVEQLENDEPTTEIGKDDSFEQGEANLVDGGDTPETELEPLDYDEEEDEEKQHGSDEDTEEIIERYQHPKSYTAAKAAKTGDRVAKESDPTRAGTIVDRVGTNCIVKFDDGKTETVPAYSLVYAKQWADRVVGKVWRAKNGRIYAKLEKGQKLASELKPGDNKDLTDDGNPEEVGAAHQPLDTGAVIKEEHLDAIGKAADHLDAMANGYSSSPETHGQHAESLRSVHRDLSDMGNPAELKDGPEGAEGGGDLTEEVGKDVHKIDGHECEGGDNDDPECRAMFAAQDRGGKSAKKPVSKTINADLRKALADAKVSQAALARTGRMHGLLNGSN